MPISKVVFEGSRIIFVVSRSSNLIKANFSVGLCYSDQGERHHEQDLPLADNYDSVDVIPVARSYCGRDFGV